MKFVYHEASGEDILKVSGDLYKYLFRVRRLSKGEILPFRNLKDDFLYFYEIEDIKRKEASLLLKEKKVDIKKPLKKLTLFWCVIDPKTIEKSLAMLNEIGVSKIVFVYCDRSQKNFRLDFKRFERILINSSMQCGRSSLMRLDLVENIDKIDKKSLFVLDFDKKNCKDIEKIEKLLIGPEGGFSEREKELLKDISGFSFKTPLVLKSETASISASSKILL